MKLNKLSLKDRKLFNRYLTFSSHELAAFSFANIYIWRTLYAIDWVVIQKSLCIFFRDQVGCFMYLPPLAVAPQSGIIRQAFVIMDKINKNKDISRIENIQQEDLDYYRSLGYLVREKYPDYLCLRSDLALLRGNKFKSQRAAYNYFIKHYDYDSHRFGLAEEADCLNLFDSWIKERKAQCNDDVYCGMLEDNRKVIKDALVNYKQLNLEGIVVRVNKEIKAFSFGYQLNSNIFCILYEITDLAIKGLAQFIFRQFSQELKDYKYINIMDDSGLENLRKTKLAYKPARLIPAYIVTRDDRRY
ncbi:MAG: phosphatidylglycerol lysyltransferase domain-containing protein [Candidatus Omnitrophota bacterium]|nr:phosphatidylglycerol lysyltransferase domain-containing protein [Candidatus Omnitrophota bacterium]